MIRKIKIQVQENSAMKISISIASEKNADWAQAQEESSWNLLIFQEFKII